ncbi:MAG: hypothetical protein R3D84_09075 [Paracoccaceae bacterium]
MRFLLILSLGLWPLFAGPAAAQHVANPGDDLTAALGAAGDGGTVTLAAGDYSAPLEVIGQSVTVAGGGARFDAVAGQSIVYLDAAASLTLTDATLQTGDGEQAGIFLDGGSLTLRDVRLSGPFRFAIYATAGSRLVLERVAVEGAANGLYLLDDVQFSLTEGEFIDLGELAIGAFGAKVIGKAEGVAVTGATESGLMVRDGATMDLRRASFSGMTGRALYLDNGGTLDAAEITITDAAAGLAAFGAGAITLDRTAIDGFGSAGITVDGAARLTLSNLSAKGEGNALATGGAIAEVSMVDASLANTGADRATVFLGHSGATALRQVAASGPYVAVYLQGTRGAITDISYSEFSASGFAAAVLQAMPAEDPANSALFDTVRLDGSGDAVALALDSVSLARVVNSELVARGSAPLSFYESGRLEASGSILLGAADHWALGSAETDLEEPSKANVIRTGIDFASADFAALLGEAQDAREAAEIAALELGQVRVVNETGVPAFGEAAELELENAEGEVFALSLASPVEVPGGQYRFRVDGVEQGEVSVSADAPLQLELPDPQHPWFAFWDGERYLRGPAMRLRPRAELARNWAARGVLVHSYRAWLQTGFAERRTGLAPEDSAAILAEARAAYFANFATAHQGYLNQNASEEDRMGQATQYALAPVLAALGTAEDVPALLDLLPADYSFPANRRWMPPQ